ncbi:hypothetical protein UPYG_G00141450 [Umbra pygmaea]|uniref:Uncharacterized protein n=1 Tax=Umbra pygmaea TaxID=75934 RepID=A0ABD0WVE9_UMBPY
MCWKSFHIKMENISKDHWCNWGKVIRIYNDVSSCMEELTMYFSCYYPNQVAHDFFNTIHSQYFQGCLSEEDMFPDAPSDVVLTLTLIPVSLIPIMVFLVVWKNKALD